MRNLWNRIVGWFNDRVLRRVLRNSTYLILSNLISVFLTIFITRRLGVYNYGLLGLITSYVTNVNKLFSFRMNEVVVRYVGEAYVNQDYAKTGALIKFAALVEAVTSLFAFIFMAVTARLGASIFLDDPELCGLIMFYGISILGGIVMETANGVLRVINRYRSIAIVSLVQNVIVAAIVFFAAKNDLGLMGILSAYMIGKVLLGVAPVILCAVWLPHIIGSKWWKAPIALIDDKKSILRFTISTNISSTINLFARDGELLWVGALLSPLHAGYYKTAMTVINMVLTPINPLIDTSYPEMNRAIIQKKWSKIRRLLRKITVLSGIWTGLAFLGLLFLGKPLLFHEVNFLGLSFRIFREEFLPAYDIIMILMFGYGIANVLFWNRTLLLTFSEADFATTVSFYSMLAKMFFTVVLVPRGPYYIEAILLSAYLAVSVLIMTARGLHNLKLAEKEAAE
jgi:O-antigen/teichoic acid export membrane protein